MHSSTASAQVGIMHTGAWFGNNSSPALCRSCSPVQISLYSSCQQDILNVGTGSLAKLSMHKLRLYRGIGENRSLIVYTYMSVAGHPI